MKRVFVGLIRDHRTRVGRIRAVRESVAESGGEGEGKDSEG